MEQNKILQSKQCRKVLFITVIGWLLSTSNPSFGKEKPNVIYILADDLGYGDLSCYGQEKFSTPHIDRLASQGKKFTNHYSGSTVSAPSRSSLMTGLHTGHTPIRGNGNIALPDQSLTVAEVFKKAGYTTGMFGKWGLGEVNTSGEPNKQGFDDYYGYLNQSRAHRYYIDYLIDNGKKDYLPGNDLKKLTTYAADVIHDKALRFIDNNASKPFFLYCPYLIPHAELIVPKDSIFEKFEGRFLPEKTYKGSDYIGAGTNIGGYISQNQCHAVFAAMVYRLDKYVGEIVKKVNDLGLSENTLIIFTSDNGPHNAGGGHPSYFNGSGGLRGIKRDLYEGGIRVPFIASWPGTITQGTRTNHVSSFWDFLPTCAELVNEEIPETLDGISYLPELIGQGAQEKPDFLYWEFFEKNGRRAVRKGKWKAVQYKMKNNPYTDVKLFDLEKDPKEETNIASNKPDTVRLLHNLMEMSHVRSKDFSWAYEANKLRATFFIVADNKPVSNIKVNLKGNGSRISWKNGQAVYTGVTKSTNSEISVYEKGNVIYSKPVTIKTSDIVDTIDLSSVYLTRSFAHSGAAIQIKNTNGRLTVTSPMQYTSIELYSLSGRLVHQGEFASYSVSFCTKKLPVGIYTLKIANRKNVISKKVALLR